MLVELVEHEAHAVHEAVHVRRLALVVCRALVRRKRGLEGLKVLHPLDGEVVRVHVCLVEDKDEREFGFVEYAAGTASVSVKGEGTFSAEIDRR